MKVFIVHEEGKVPAEPTAYTAATQHDAEMDYIATYCATTEDTNSELVEYVPAAKLDALVEAGRNLSAAANKVGEVVASGQDVEAACVNLGFALLNYEVALAEFEGEGGK